MANLTENSIWENGIYQLETDDPTLGGPPGFNLGEPVTGHANAQAQQLANRTKYLKDRIDAIPAEVDAAGTADLKVSTHNSDPTAHPELTSFITSEADRAELAADAASVNGSIYADTSIGLAGTVDGQYFSVPSSDDEEYLILYKNNTGSALEVKRYPSADAVQKPSWAGRKNAWPDTFFRRFDLTSQTFLGRDRWWWNSVGAGPFEGWSRVANTRFSGYALRRTSGYNTTSYSGPSVMLDEIGVGAGDTVTAYVLISGPSGLVYSGYRFTGDSDAIIQESGSMLSDTGATNISASTDPKWLRISKTVPVGATRLHLYPYNISGSTGFDLLAVWAFRGGINDGPKWPSLEDSYFDIRDVDIETRLESVEADVSSLKESSITANAEKQIRSGFVPYVVWQSQRGDTEMDGDNSYSGVAKTIGFYEQMSDDTLFNAITGRVWATDGAADIEWKVWIRDTAAGFNMQSVAADASGTILAGEFPTSNTKYTLKLQEKLYALSGKYVFVMFRAANDTTINSRTWIYDSGVIPARHGMPFTVASGGWNNTIVFGNPATLYGAVAMKVLLESDELRAKSGATSAADTSYNNATSGLSATNVQSAIDEISTSSPEIVMPPYVYGVQGRECNVYFDNLHLSRADDYLHNITSASSTGQQQNERWTWIPSGSLASGTLTVAVHDKRTGKLLSSKTAQQRSAASTSGSGATKKVLVIGDSLINAGTITQTLIDVASTDTMSVTMLGTQGVAPNKHEGRGGWTVSYYTSAGPTYYDFTVSGVSVSPAINSTEYSHNGSVYRVQEVNLTGGSGTIRCSVVSGGAPLASGTLTKSNGGAGDAIITFSASAEVPGNPFWIGGTLDFSQYLSNNSIATPDWVLIGLGINDCFNQTDDAACSSLADTELTKLDMLIASIKAADASVKIGLMIPSPPSADQDSFGYNYATGQTRWRFKRNILIWARQMIAKYTGQEANRIYLVPSNTALDTVNNMNTAASAPVNSRSSVTKARQNNGVHPAVSGYQQIGDAIWAFLKFYA